VRAYQRQQRLQAIIDQVLDPQNAADLDPLIVVRTVMRVKLQAGDFDGAAALALQCMPYVHPKLISAHIAVRNEYANVSDEELQRRIYAERQAIQSRMLEATGKVIEVEA
jgi:hypothetical protein